MISRCRPTRGLHLEIVLKSKLLTYSMSIVLRFPMCSHLYSMSFMEIILKLHNFMYSATITPFFKSVHILYDFVKNIWNSVVKQMDI